MITYTVEGHTPFPIDMLRYDSCFPAHEKDSHLIIRTLDETITPPLGPEPYRVEVSTLRDHRTHAMILTPARWKSFGWRVME